MRIATVQVSARNRFGGVAVNAVQQVTAFLEKGHDSAGAINGGLYRIHRDAFEGEKPGVLSLETELMPRLVVQSALTARELVGPFVDIGIPKDYRLFDANVHSYVYED